MNDEILQELEKVVGPSRIRLDEPMSAHTTFKIGGPAKYYVDISLLDDLIKVVQAAKKLELPVFILGGGSNIIVLDKGFHGLVIKNNCRKFDLLRVSGRIKKGEIAMDKAMVYAESGVIMSQLVRFTIDQGLEGLEYQLGLPGTVGGGIFMNSNFPKQGKYVGDCVLKATLLTKDGEIKEVDRSYFRFAYDKSILQETGEILLSVVFQLLSGDKKVLWERGMDALNYRNATQPKGASAGCTFRNISFADAMTIPTPQKITSAGYLIDKAGLKGKHIGDAMISDLHANFILNRGQAKAGDVVALVDLMKSEVLKQFGVHLALEVRTVGN